MRRNLAEELPSKEVAEMAEEHEEEQEEVAEMAEEHEEEQEAMEVNGDEIESMSVAEEEEVMEEALEQEKEGGEEAEGIKLGEEVAEEESVEDITWTISVMLYGFLCMNMSMLYLANWKDPDIRVQVYSIVCVTLSIFCAVLANEAVFSFLLDQVVASPFPRGLGFGVEVAESPGVGALVGSAVFFILFILINVIGWKFQGRNSLLYGVKVIGGHLVAFAAIHALGELQHHEWFSQSAWRLLLVPVLGYALFESCRQVSKRWRERRSGHEPMPMFLEPPPITGSEILSSFSATRSASHLSWEEQVAEAEEEAFYLSQTYLVHQVICYLICGYLPKLKESEQKHYEVEIGDLSMWSAGFCLSLSVLTFAVCKVSRCELSGDNQKTVEHVVGTMTKLQNAASMMMSWCLFRVIDWQTQVLIATKAQAHLLGGFATTGLSIGAILVLDAIADKLPEMLTWLSGGPSQLNINLNQEHVQEVAAAQEKAIRTVIAGIAILHGLSWEKAFDASLETIVDGSTLFRSHPVLTKSMLGLGVVVFVVPGWRRHFVPKAMMTKEQHQEIIDGETKSAK